MKSIFVCAPPFIWHKLIKLVNSYSYFLFFTCLGKDIGIMRANHE